MSGFLNLMATLKLDSSEYNKGLEEASTKAKGFGGKLKTAFGGVVKAGALLSAGAVAVGGTIFKLASDTAKAGDNIDKMSQKIGISSEAYQKWDYVMKRSGGSVDSLKAGMKTLSKAVESGSKDFEKLGISQKELKNASQEEVLEKTIKGLAGMKEGTERTALATKLLGKAGMDMAPLLNQGTKAIDEQMEMAEKYGMVMSDKTVKASANFQDSLTTLSGTVKGLKNRFMGEFLPSMTKVTDGLALLFVGDTDKGIEKIEKGLDGFTKKAEELIPKMLEVGGKILDSVSQGIISNIPTFATKAVDILMSMAQYFIDNLPQLIDTGIQMMMAIGQGLSESLPKLIAKLPGLIVQIANVFAQYDWLAIGANIMTWIGSGLLSALGAITKPLDGVKNSVVTALKNTVNNAKATWNKIVTTVTAPIVKAKNTIDKNVKNIKTSLSNTWTSIKTTASKAWNSVKEAITKPINKAKETVNSAIKKLKSLFPLKVGKIFTGLKIPKISVSGGKPPYGIGGLGKAPKIDVKWNKFAEAVPYIFKKGQATLFGAGDANDEIIYGKKNLLSDIEQAVHNQIDDFAKNSYNYVDDKGSFETAPSFDEQTVISQDSQVETILNSYLPLIVSKLTNMQIVLNDGTLVGKLSPKIDENLGNVYKVKERRNAY